MKIKLNNIELDLTDEQVQEIVSKYNKPKSKRWRAEYEGEYWYVDGDGDIFEQNEDFDIYDNQRYEIGNYFQTEQQAKTHLKHLQLLQKLKDEIAELNGDWVCDWSNEQEHKFMVYWYNRQKRFIVTCDKYEERHLSELYMNGDTLETILSTWSKEDLYLALYGKEL